MGEEFAGWAVVYGLLKIMVGGIFWAFFGWGMMPAFLVWGGLTVVVIGVAYIAGSIAIEEWRDRREARWRAARSGG